MSKDFSWALQKVKQGYKVSRAGWNGAGMWIALTPGSSFVASLAKKGHAAKHRANEGAVQIDLLPHIDMRTVDGSISVGWVANQADLLADDWSVVE